MVYRAKSFYQFVQHANVNYFFRTTSLKHPDNNVTFRLGTVPQVTKPAVIPDR